MFRQGTLSRSVAGWFVVGAFVIGGIAEMRSVRDAATLTNTVRDTGESGAGIIAGSLSGGGSKFDEAFDIAAAPSKPSTN